MPNQVLVNPADLRIGQDVTVWELNEDNHRTFGQGGRVGSVIANLLVLKTTHYGERTYNLHCVDVVEEVPFPLTDCIQYGDGSGECHGDVEFFSPRGLGGPLRCEYHRERRMESYENSMELYADSDVIPDWFDPADAGERWEDD